MKKILFTLLIISNLSINAQSVFGKWENWDEEENRVNSVIEIYEKDGLAFGKIIKITHKDRQGAVCDKCKGERKNMPILNMTILSGLKKEGNQWIGGTIVDVKNGKEYKCYITLENENKLKIRGYFGFVAFGRTAYWCRKK
ncbi:DUF2147 domain-containing protein [Tenacibaculum pacificus]|uniref:DUF2147 domain-containing protein n=1 Tax=Tenacibaculum TaxID=104267 RepID=UPI0022F39C4B|nr:DUF2147 domain-containing protein [Tenacibaculum pacificus]WBX73150.1 DUF2147 domain-containing protein [Tenacibaculum pacificus]